MSGAVDAKFSCGGCGKTYKWKLELAGKRAKCKCGHVMTVPNEMPGGDDDELGDLYALAEDAHAQKNNSTVEIRCPNCQSPMEVGATMCTTCGYNVKTGRRAGAVAAAAAPALAVAGAGAGPTSPILGYSGATPASRAAGKDEVGDNNLIEYYIPCGLIIFGLIVSMIQTMHFTTNPVAFGAAMVMVVVTTVIDLVLMLGACFIAAKILDATFGAPGPAILKLAGISLAPEAVASIVANLMGPSTGWLAGWIIAIILYYALFSYLFDLDLGEVLVLVFVIRFLRLFVGAFIVVALFALLMGGRGAGIANSLANAASGSRTSVHASSHSDDDDQIEETLGNTQKCQEAKLWLNESGNRIFGKEPHSDSLEMTQQLYDAGAKEVVAVKEKGVGYTEEVIVRLPKEQAKRDKIFAWHKDHMDKYNWEETSDDGQKYLALEFDPFMSAGERAQMKAKFKNSTKREAKNDNSDDEQ